MFGIQPVSKWSHFKLGHWKYHLFFSSFRCSCSGKSCRNRNYQPNGYSIHFVSEPLQKRFIASLYGPLIIGTKCGSMLFLALPLHDLSCWGDQCFTHPLLNLEHPPSHRCSRIPEANILTSQTTIQWDPISELRANITGMCLECSFVVFFPV